MKYPAEVVEAAVVIARYLYPDTSTDLFANLADGIKMPLDLSQMAIVQRARPQAEDLKQLWNRMKNSKLSTCRALTNARRRKCNARLKEYPDLKAWERFMQFINQSGWMCGEKTTGTHAGWRATFDFFIKPESIVRFLEGSYSGSRQQQQSDDPRERFSDNIDKRNAFLEDEVF